jgi:hypothetical protein
MKVNVSWRGGQVKKPMSLQCLIKVLAKMGSFIDDYASTCEFF